ncbi:MAG: ABC-F family ATP-binding cassette domain-containing protein [Bacteroidales bacterium]|jgi:ATP-binding cassette subfamily F protein 3|nr:ABC-F family ATP-binding cassette domain-containing protein [Bacteroidales bacterium]
MISINQLSVSFSGNPLFNDISFIIKDNDRIGLTGKNGAGKSTLLKILAGQQQADKGSIVLTSGHEVGYLPQEMELSYSRSIINEALQAFDKTIAIEKQIKRLQNEISQRSDYETAEYHTLLEKLAEQTDRYHLLGGGTERANAEKILLGLGFKHSDFKRPVKEFSSGWQMRVELAKILLRSPEVMLLDEPTNHLDIESIEWLEDFLQNYQGAVVVVSHDRKFLDNITKRTIEIVLGRIEDYNVPYSDYVVQRQERRDIQQAAYDNQQKEIEQIERFIERFRYKATKARQAQSRLKMLEKKEIIEIDTFDNSSIAFRFPPAPHSGKVVVKAQHVGKAYGSLQVFSDIDFTLERGEKVAFVGKNGEGKTTFSRIIVGEIDDYSGALELGHQVSIGYFAQNQNLLLDGEKTVFETLDDIAAGGARVRVRRILGSFLFSGEDIEKKVKVLSGGEKTRLALAKLLLSPVNLLVLDEPTNHLDMRSKDILKNALLQYDGSLIVVSHDRDFLEELTQKVYEFRSGRVKQHIGDIADFLRERKIERLSELERGKSATDKAVNSSNNSRTNKSADTGDSNKDTMPVGTTQTTKLSYHEQKQIEREKRKQQQKTERLEKEIASLEKELAALSELMTTDPTQCSTENCNLYDKLKRSLDSKMDEWANFEV